MKYHVLLLLIFVATSTFAMTFPSNKCEQVLQNDLVGLWYGQGSKAKVERTIAIALEAFEHDPFSYELLFRIARRDAYSVPEKLLKKFPLSVQTELFDDKRVLVSWVKPILQSMELRSRQGDFIGMRSPVRLAEESNDFLNRKAPTDMHRLPNHQLPVYWEKVGAVANKILEILERAGIRASAKRVKFLHPSSHVIERNGGIGIAFEHARLTGQQTLPCFLISAWGRYDIVAEKPLMATTEQIARIHNELTSTFGLRLIQSEYVGMMFGERTIYELAVDALGSPLPPVYERQGLLSGADTTSALRFGGFKIKEKK